MKQKIIDTQSQTELVKPSMFVVEQSVDTGDKKDFDEIFGLLYQPQSKCVINNNVDIFFVE